MNNICRRYISDVKTLFPIMGKPERKYIRSLIPDIEECCELYHIDSIEALYDKYADPAEVVNNYYSTSKPTELIRRIRVSKWIIRGIATLILAVVVVSAAHCIELYHVYKVFESQQVFFERTTIK